jgi:hypothetical protein
MQLVDFQTLFGVQDRFCSGLGTVNCESGRLALSGSVSLDGFVNQLIGNPKICLAKLCDHGRQIEQAANGSEFQQPKGSGDVNSAAQRHVAGLAVIDQQQVGFQFDCEADCFKLAEAN